MLKHMTRVEISIFRHRLSLLSCWDKFRAWVNSVRESKVPLRGLKGKERECHVTPLGRNDSDKEAQITRGKECDPEKAQQAPTAALKSHGEVTIARLYGGASQFVANPSFP